MCPTWFLSVCDKNLLLDTVQCLVAHAASNRFSQELKASKQRSHRSDDYLSRMLDIAILITSANRNTSKCTSDCVSILWNGWFKQLSQLINVSFYHWLSWPSTDPQSASYKKRFNRFALYLLRCYISCQWHKKVSRDFGCNRALSVSGPYRFLPSYTQTPFLLPLLWQLCK